MSMLVGMCSETVCQNVHTMEEKGFKTVTSQDGLVNSETNEAVVCSTSVPCPHSLPLPHSAHGLALLSLVWCEQAIIFWRIFRILEI